MITTVPMKNLKSTLFILLSFSISTHATDADLKTQLQKLEAQFAEFKKAQDSGPTAKESSTNIGGYGEFVYHNYSKESSRSMFDFKRFVLTVGHRFNDQISLESEFEVEHAVTSYEDSGEVAMEQAFINYRFQNGLNLKGGLFLMPFGYINLYHEPPVFYGVLRNDIETRIIPSTWREGGIALSSANDSAIKWEAGLVTGLNVANFESQENPLADMRQKTMKAKASDLAVYGALGYSGWLGTNIGLAVYTGNSTQNNAAFKDDSANPDFTGLDGRVTLYDVHGRWQRYGFDLQALYARGSIGDAGAINDAISAYNTTVPVKERKTFVPNEFYGWLLQAAYTVWTHGDMSLAPFVRLERFNTQADMPNGYASNALTADRVVTAGLSFKPHRNVVVKSDYQKYSDNPRNDKFNMGLGYMF